MTHQDSMMRCCVYHGPEGPCIKCAVCREWIRPSKMNEECPGKPAEPVIKETVLK